MSQRSYAPHIVSTSQPPADRTILVIRSQHDSPGVEAGVGASVGRGVGGAAGLREVKLALISSNGVRSGDDEGGGGAVAAALGDGIGGGADMETPLNRTYGLVATSAG